MASQPDINSDLTPEALAGDRVPQAGDVQTIEIPDSSWPTESHAGEPNWDPFGENEAPAADALFDTGETPTETSYRPPVRAAYRPLSASLLAIALADPSTTNDITLLSEANLNAARALLDNQQEYNARLKVASDRAVDSLMYVDRLGQQFEARAQQGESVPEGVQELIQNTYQNVMTRDREQDARTAIEFEAIDRIRTYMTQNDPEEAALAFGQSFGFGDSDKREFWTAEGQMLTEMTKTLIASQRLEELEAEYSDSGWVRGFFNGVVRMIPFTDAFSASGILDDAGIDNDDTGLLNFFLRGPGLVDQRESLWNLPLDQFAEALAPDGPIMKSIKANAEWLMADPTRSAELGRLLLAGNQPAGHLETAFGVLDMALVAGGAVGRTTKILKGLGARSAAVDQTTRAALETIRSGSEAARAATAVGVEELTENLTSSMFMKQTGVSMGTDVASSLRTAEELRTIFPDILATHQLDNADDLRAAFQVYEQSIKEQYGDYVKDIRLVEENVRTGTSAEFAGTVTEDGATLYRIEVTIGKKEGGGYSKAAYVEGLFERFGRQGEVFRDPETGAYYGKFEVAVPLDGFITSDLNTPEAVIAAVRSSARTADPVAVGKGIIAGNAANRFLRQTEETLRAAIKGVGRRERKALNEIIKKGQNEAVWYSEDQFAVHYERLYGSYPTPAVQQAYDTYRSVHDLVYLIRNDAVYMKKYNQGFESFTFRMAGRDVDLDAVMNLDPKKRPLGRRMWDAHNDRWLADNISADEVKAMVDEGYVMLRLDTPFELPTGQRVEVVMTKKSDLVQRPLRRTQLNYSQGGSRAYDATHFIKQAAEDVEGNLVNPRTFIAGKGLNEMKAWADDMNRALALARAGETDLLRFEDIFRNRPGFPSPQEFLDMINQRQLSLKYDFEVVEDQVMPSAYFNKDPQALRFVDFDETAIDSYHRSMGRMYYGTKGEHLRDVTGDFAETIDPWNTLNSTINEAAKTYSFNGYKQNVLERFKNTYGSYLQVDSIDQLDSLYGLANAEVSRTAPSKIAGLIKQEQGAIRRLLNFETGFEKTLRNRWRSAAEWILKDSAEGSFRGRTRSAMYWLEKNNPVQFMRTLAFDANLGFFNIGQLFVQTSTIMSAMALKPGAAMKGIPLLHTMKAYALSKYSDNLLDVLAKNGSWKGAFETAEEFKTFARTMRDSGLYEVSGHNLAMIREYGANKIFGAGAGYDAVSEKGRMFFYLAEQMNRTVAARIAWDDLKALGLKQGTAGFRERFAALTDDYSFNMMSQTSAAFQHGLPSIPTQFWAYGFRMMDALFGKRFTPAQKFRLLIMNAGMAGAAGVPGGALIKQLYEEYTGQPISIEDADGWVARGLYDGIAYALTGSDVEIGARIGTAEQLQNIIKDLFGQGDYGEKSVYEMIAGASGAKLMSAVPALGDLIRWQSAEVLGYETGGVEEDKWLRMGQEIASVRNTLRGFLAMRYGGFWSKNGSQVAADLPSSDAFFFALGFTPGAQTEMSYYFEQADDQTVEDAAKQLSQWRQDAFTYPDRFEENRQKAAAFMTLFTPSERRKIRERAQRAVNSDMVTTMQQRWEKEMVESEFYDELVPSIEERVETNGR